MGKKNLGKTVIIIATIAMATEVVALVVTEAVETGEIAKGAIAKVVTEVVVVVSVVVSMTETILVILFQLEIIFHPEIASSCPRNNPIPTIILQKKPKKERPGTRETRETRARSPKPTTRALVMSLFPEQNDPPHNSKKIPFSDYISIIDFYVSTVRIRLPDRKVLFDSFVKRKLRLPMSRGHVLFLEFFRIYSIKKCVMFTK